AKRLTALPQIPTVAEVGYADFELNTWFGLMAPAGTPEPVIGKLHAAFVQAVHAPEVVKQMIDQGAEPVTDTPREFAAYIDLEIKRLGSIVTSLGIKGESATPRPHAGIFKRSSVPSAGGRGARCLGPRC